MACRPPWQSHIERYERFNMPPSQEELQQRQEAYGQELDTCWGEQGAPRAAPRQQHPACASGVCMCRLRRRLPIVGRPPPRLSAWAM